MKNFQKYVCCFDLTLATRLIASIGLVISAVLTSVLINDKFGHTNFDASRKTALALGLDWQHFHAKANATHHADPEGKLISAIVVFYAVLYLLTSMLLIFATITLNRWCAAPWLLCELFGCISKSVAMIFHALDHTNHLSNTFVIGSICYIILMIWWWTVVFVAQTTWMNHPNYTFQFSMTPKPSVSMSSRLECEELPTITTARPPLLHSQSFIDSPVAYTPNNNYSEI